MQEDQISPSVDELLDRAVAAMNRGEVTAAHELAGAALAVDAANRDAAALLAAEPGPPGGELRRTTLSFVDLVGSTPLSARIDPELYRTVLRRYKALCREAIEVRYGGHISHTGGDGLLAVFGLPTPHENDTERAIRAALDIIRGLRTLSAEVEPVIGEPLEARAAVHYGLVYLDIEEDEVYGLAANVAARLQTLAEPGTVVISDEVQAIVGPLYDTVAQPAQRVKGVDHPLRPHRVLAELPDTAARGRPRSGQLVDRVDERAQLRARWEDARGGRGTRPQGVHLVADAGMGKSRLAGALAEDVHGEVAARVELLGSPFHAEASFHAVRTLVEDRCGIGSDMTAAVRLARLEDHLAACGLPTAEVVPLLAPVLDVPPDAGYEPETTEGRKLHERIIDAAARYLLALTAPGPALLLVEDVHWCDGSTLDAVGQVLHSDRADLLVVATSREPPPPPLSRLEALHLAPLDASAAAELVTSVDPTIDADRCVDLIERSDGVPLFLEELARAPAGPAPGATAGLSITPSPAGPTGPVPDVLYEPLVARLYATPSGVAVAAAAAAIGRDVDRRLLEAAAVDVSPRELDDAIAALLGGLILERAGDDEERYRFRHELLRAVAYDLQPQSRRRELHGRVADALAHTEVDVDLVDWRLAARHYDAADRADEAIAAYDRAAEGARRRGALAEARALLARAVELVDGLPDGPDRRSREVGLRLRRGFLAVSIEGYSSPDAVRDYERCLEIALGDVTGDEMFSTLISLWAHYMMRGDLTRAHRVTELLRAGTEGVRDVYLPDNEAAFGTIRWLAGDFGPAHEQLEAAVAGLAARATTPTYASTWFMPNDAPASTHVSLALARFMRGDTKGADEQIEAALRRCATVEFPFGPFTAAHTLFYAAWMAVERGDLMGAADKVDQLVVIAERHGFDVWALAAATQRASIGVLEALDAGADAAGLATHGLALDSMIATWQMLDVALFLPFYMAIAGRAQAANGDLDAATARLEDALRCGRETGMHFYDAEVLRLRAQVAALAGADDEVVPRLEAARDVARAQGAVPFEQRIARDLVAAGS